MSVKTAVIGSGFAGISAACYLAKEGHEVHVYEKNLELGGRARMFETHGFRFDMGPSWYWMPDVFEKFFNDFDKSTSDYYLLKRLDPSYRIFFDHETRDFPASYEQLLQLIESWEKGASLKLEKFINDARYKYEAGIKNLVYKPGLSLTEFIDIKVLKWIFQLQLFQSVSQNIAQYFKHPDIIKWLEFPVLFLGASPQETPALYTLMNFADIKLGTWYPMGGINQVINGMVSLAESLGVTFHAGWPVEKIEVKNHKATGIVVNGQTLNFDVILGGADYHHIEQQLLEPQYRNYTQKYWDKRTLAPSSLIFYLGINKKIEGLEHHNLFFDKDFKLHAHEIYKSPKWPSEPLFYICVPSKTDPLTAPDGHENLFILMPIAPGLEDRNDIRELYFDMILQRIKDRIDMNLKDHIVFKKSFAIKDFINDYNSFKGNAYGLANTLNQTAILKPSIKNKKVSNLYYTGQLTVPGPGVPPSLISGNIVASQIIKNLRKQNRHAKSL